MLSFFRAVNHTPLGTTESHTEAITLNTSSPLYLGPSRSHGCMMPWRRWDGSLRIRRTTTPRPSALRSRGPGRDRTRFRQQREGSAPARATRRGGRLGVAGAGLEAITARAALTFLS
jgi:hypothetical protein